MNASAATVTAENVLIAAPQEPLAESAASSDWVIDDGLPPPTHAQVNYWR